MNKRMGLYGLAMLLLALPGAKLDAQFAMPPPAEPVDAMPPSIRPLPPHAAQAPAAEQCHINVNDIYFGYYVSEQRAPVETAMGITIECSAQVRVSISAEPSPDSPSFDYRLMRGEGGQHASLRYELFTDWKRSVVWGDGTGDTRPIIVDAGAVTVADVFGTIDANQNVPPGEYSDEVVVTLEVQ